VVASASGGDDITERSDSPMPRRSARPTSCIAPISFVESVATARAMSASAPPFVATTRATI
jgi:hypothetical protein